MCQGNGIFLTKSIDWMNHNEHYVAQKYLSKPYLIEELKFDLRIYVLITGISPLRCFIYKEGMARFATEKYKSPTASNIENHFMHLTNYAINKEHHNYIFNKDTLKDNVGHKRSMASIFNHIDSKRILYHDIPPSEQVWEEIKQLCIKTIFSVIHQLEHGFRSSKPNDLENSLCF
jgi:tubulin polyglutamylase TTLL6/13